MGIYKVIDENDSTVYGENLTLEDAEILLCTEVNQGADAYIMKEGNQGDY